MSRPDLVNGILQQLQQPFTAELLFDQLPDIVFFIKNALGQYAVVNETLVERCGLKSKGEIVGKTPTQLFRPPLGQNYEAQDRRVIETGRPLLAQLELHVYPARDVGWCLTSKLPLLREEGTAVGLVGVSQDLRLPDPESDEYQAIAAAVEHARDRLADSPSVTELASIAGMSRYQLDRRMKQVYGLSTGQWLIKLRVDSARRRLIETEDAISAISTGSGYSDQSTFTRQFRQATGLSPRQFRQVHRQKR